MTLSVVALIVPQNFAGMSLQLLQIETPPRTFLARPRRSRVRFDTLVVIFRPSSKP